MNLEAKHIQNHEEALAYYASFVEKHYPLSFQKSLSFSDLKSPYYLGTCVVFYDNNLLALVSVFYNEQLQYQGKRTLCFGYYECIDDQTTAQFLGDKLEAFAKQNECGMLVGPLNGSTWNNYRFGSGALDDLFFTERYHQSFYSNQIQSMGYAEIGRYESRIDRNMQVIGGPKAVQMQKIWSNRNLKIRSMNMANFKAEIATIHKFCLEAFQHNFLYTPIDFDCFKQKYEPIELYINPTFVLMAEENSELVGLLFAIPDFYASEEKRLIVKTIAKKPGRASAGITHLLGDELVKRAKEQSYTALIHAFMHVSNASAQISKHFSGEQLRQYVLLAKPISHEA